MRRWVNDNELTADESELLCEGWLPMGLRDLFRRIDREHWFICYACLGSANHDETKAIFHSMSPKVEIVGRLWQKCPRCGDTNTKSFTELKAEGQDSALWGLERVVKKRPQSLFDFGNPPK
jgi:hypothetical protein